MSKIKFSIIFAEIRPQTSEKISVGLVILSDSKIDIRYSDRKLKALEYLYSKSEQKFVADVVRSMDCDESIKDLHDIEYLSRYSNNLVSFSPVESIDLDATKENKEWLFNNYVGGKSN